MSLLAKNFREAVSKLKDFGMKVEAEPDIGYPTGFLSYDFRNGMIINGINPNGEPAPYHLLGIPDGSLVMVVGRTSSGKTTFVIQAAANIIRPFKTSCIFHDDIESGIAEERKAILTRFNDEDLENRFIHRNTGITAENFYERIKMIHDLKTNNRSEYEYDTGQYSKTGKRIYKLEPTVYILDSLALLMPSKYANEEDLSGQMAATAAAKANAAIFKRVIPMLKMSNIILMVINHITQKIDISMFARSKSQTSYLRQSENIPGGFTPLYLSSILLRFDDHTKLKEEETFGIDGILVDINTIKSRYNKSGQVVTLVFNQSIGFDPDLSLLVLLKQYKRVNGAGAHLYIDDHKDIKFSQKQFKEKLKENKQLREIVTNAAYEVLSQYIYRNEMEEVDEDYKDVTALMLEKIIT